jgi:hypothetical protein
MAITWKIDVQPGKYLVYRYQPDGTEVHWNVYEHLADGSIV